MSAPATQRSPAGSHSFDYCRFIELDHVAMETGFMVSMRPSRGLLSPQRQERRSRRQTAPVSIRDPYGNLSPSTSSNSGSCKGSDGSPSTRQSPGTPRHQVKYQSCGDNHGIRPPPPEQYLTPLQQKEVCIRHLRARLKENVERLQDRDTEIEELKAQLLRMQEDWIEEECHRVEAQLALKEARKEILQLKQVVELVRSQLGPRDAGVHRYFQDISVQNRKLETLLRSVELAQDRSPVEVRPGLSRSCGGSPARSLTRSSTYTKLSCEALPDGSGADLAGLSGEGTQDSGFAGGGSRADLLLEPEPQPFLPGEALSLPLPGSCAPFLPRSATYEKLGSREATSPLRRSVSSNSHPCLSHQHHQLCPSPRRERAVQTDRGPLCCWPSPDGSAGERWGLRSQACSPHFAWISEEGDDLDGMATAPPADIPPSPRQPPPAPSSSSSSSRSCAGESAPHTCQPRGGALPAELCGVTVVEVEEDEEEDESGDRAAGDAAKAPQKTYWSRHFLVDLLAVGVPVVPAVAWMCRGPCRYGEHACNFGSLLRSCCALALHSLRRVGGAGGGAVRGGSTQI